MQRENITLLSVPNFKGEKQIPPLPCMKIKKGIWGDFGTLDRPGTISNSLSFVQKQGEACENPFSPHPGRVGSCLGPSPFPHIYPGVGQQLVSPRRTASPGHTKMAEGKGIFGSCGSVAGIRGFLGCVGIGRCVCRSPPALPASGQPLPEVKQWCPVTWPGDGVVQSKPVDQKTCLQA